MLTKIKELLAAQLHMEVSEIADDALLIDDLGADSLDLAEMVVELENSIGIEISDDEAADIKTVADIAALCERKAK